jgi:hypothetical protein
VIPHIVRIAALAGIADVFLLVGYHVLWWRSVLRDGERGADL